MDLIEAIKTRRSIHKFKPEPVPAEKLETILEAARWSPSGGNTQPWRFVVFSDASLKGEVAGLFQWGGALAEAPLGIAVVVDPGVSGYTLEDGSVAAYGIMLAAHAIGLGSCWVATNSNEAKAKGLLGIPAGQKLIALLAVGYADEAPTKTRKALTEFVSTGRYGGK